MVSVLLISVQPNLDIIGLKGLHHVLLERGYRSFLLYLPRFNPSQQRDLQALRRFVDEISPGFIGISLMAIDYDAAVRVTRALKRFFPDIPVAWGGIHPTTAPELCLEHADYVCIGEAEQAVLDMAKAVEEGRRLDGIPGLCHRTEEGIEQPPPYPLIEDLDSLPINRQIPENAFVQMHGRVTPLECRHLQRHKRYRGGVYKILTSRGCPYACTYCVNNFLRKLYGAWGVRRRSVAHVMEELEHALVEGPAVEYVDFTDDCFLACDLAYLDEFCHAYKARIGKPFIAKGTPKYFTSEKMDLLVDAGLVWANLGLQSGSDRVCREVYERPITSDEFKRAATLIHQYPIAAYYDVIVDNPFETEEDALETVETLMATPRPFYTLMFSLNFYLGTELRERAAAECPERLADAFGKDYRRRGKSATTELIEMAGVLHRPLMRGLLRRYRAAPDALLTRLALSMAKVYARLILLPISYFRLIRRTQRGSFWRTLRVLPVYLRDGLIYYTSAFNLFKDHTAEK